MGLDGISFVPRPPRQGAEGHEYLYWEFHERGGKRAARFGPYKAVQNDVNQKGRDAPIEIYHVVNDPAEKQNIAADEQKLVARAKEIFEEAHTPSPIWKFKWEQ